MSILVLSQLRNETLDTYVSRHILYRADLRSRNHLIIQDEIAASNATALVLSSVDQTILLSLAPDSLPSCIVIISTPDQPIDVEIEKLPNVSIVHADTIAKAEHLAFVEVERRLRPRVQHRPHSEPMGRKVILVGSGIVNLVTALELSQDGFEIEIFDRMPDPLQTTRYAPHTTGATFGGQDARVFSFNESRHHLFRGLSHSSRLNAPFRHRVSDNGWLSREASTFDKAERDWIRRLEAVPAWLAGIYNDDTIAFNRESKGGWENLFSLHPKVLRGVNFINTLLRIYQTQETLQAAARTESYIGSCLELISLDNLTKMQPCFTEAIQEKAIAGALRVEGFSLNVKSLARNLIRLLQARGVRFHWNAELNALETNSEGRVCGLRFGTEIRMANHVVLCPGAYAKLRCETLKPIKEIASMVGMWITLPNEERPLSAPLKIRRRGFAANEAAEGANVIPGHDADSRPVIYCSSGHGFVGGNPNKVDESDTKELNRCIHETAAELFPDKYAEAKRRGMLDGSPEYCVRPWTSSGLGIFDSMEMTSGGQLILIGGHNTGGFAQAPAVAQAVRSALNNQPHAMADVYHPKRALVMTA